MPDPAVLLTVDDLAALRQGLGVEIVAGDHRVLLLFRPPKLGRPTNNGGPPRPKPKRVKPEPERDTLGRIKRPRTAAQLAALAKGRKVAQAMRSAKAKS